MQGKIFSFVQQKLYIKVCVLKIDVKDGGFEPKRKLSGKLHQNFFSEQHFEDHNKEASLRRNTAAMVVRLLVMLSTRP